MAYKRYRAYFSGKYNNIQYQNLYHNQNKSVNLKVFSCS